jgi:hypothetical protein
LVPLDNTSRATSPVAFIGRGVGGFLVFAPALSLICLKWCKLLRRYALWRLYTSIDVGPASPFVSQWYRNNEAGPEVHYWRAGIFFFLQLSSGSRQQGPGFHHHQPGPSSCQKAPLTGFSYGCDKGRDRMRFCIGGREHREFLPFVPAVFLAPYPLPVAPVL